MFVFSSVTSVASIGHSHGRWRNYCRGEVSALVFRSGVRLLKNSFMVRVLKRWNGFLFTKENKPLLFVRNVLREGRDVSFSDCSVCLFLSRNRVLENLRFWKVSLVAIFFREVQVRHLILFYFELLRCSVNLHCLIGLLFDNCRDSNATAVGIAASQDRGRVARVR